jgi:hypothetical protein
MAVENYEQKKTLRLHFAVLQIVRFTELHCNILGSLCKYHKNSVLHFTYSLHLLQLEVERCKIKMKIRDSCCNNLAVACSYISKLETASSARYLIRKDSQDGS